MFAIILLSADISITFHRIVITRIVVDISCILHVRTGVVRNWNRLIYTSLTHNAVENSKYYPVPNKRTHPNKRTTPHSKKFFKNVPTQINVPPDKPKGFPKFHTSPLKSIPPLRLTFSCHILKV